MREIEGLKDMVQKLQESVDRLGKNIERIDVYLSATSSSYKMFSQKEVSNER